MPNDEGIQIFHAGYFGHHSQCCVDRHDLSAAFGGRRTMIRWDFYVHFTNLSNFLCIGVMLAGLIQTAKKKEDSYVTAAPVLKFIGMLGILLTFLVFSIMLAGAEGRDPRHHHTADLPLFLCEPGDTGCGRRDQVDPHSAGCFYGGRLSLLRLG